MEEIKLIDSSWSYYTTKKPGIVFVPSVSKQRYRAVNDLLTHVKLAKYVSTVTEYGCSSYKFFPYLKNTRNITAINFVDIDDYLLEEKIFFIGPLLYDHLNKRVNPLEVKAFEGSISDPDWRILKSDAVVGIEVIEHLFPDILEAVPYVVFQSIKPKIVIFTTPNADFNAALPKFDKFRHPDHKFEWTREQFKSWASNITLRFPDYMVTFFGVGNGPQGTAALGHCSQLAIFVRRDILDTSYNLSSLECFCQETTTQNTVKENYIQCFTCYPMQPFGICTYLTKSKEFKPTEENALNYYRLIKAYEYPYKEEDKRTKDEHILDALKSRIYNSLEFINEDGIAEIPLYKIKTLYEGQLVTEKEVKDVVLLHGYEIKNCFVKNCNGEGIDDWAPCVIYQRPETPSSDSESSSNAYVESKSSTGSDWDAENTTTIVKEDQESSKYNSRIPKSTKRMENSKKQMKGPNESGPAKTLSITGTSQSVIKDATDKVKGSCLSLKESSLRKHLKAVIMSDCKFEPLFSTETITKDPKAANRPLPDPNKVNELDCLNNRNQSKPYPFGKTFFSQIMRTQFKITSKRAARHTFKERTSPISNRKRKNKNLLSDSEDETLSHVKTIANCLLENTLNKLDIRESSKLISDHIDDPVVHTPESGTSFSSDFQVVDNPSSTDQYECNNNDVSSNEEVNTASQDTLVDFTKRGTENNNSVASREALYDPNSRADLLEDFDISPLLEGFESVQNISISNPSNNVVFLGMRPLNEDESAQPNRSIFPGWLLRLLRHNVPIDNQGTNDEWAYFYSQGDGWGNNTPWFMQNTSDENEDASSEASSSSSIAEGDDGSSFQDIVSLPDDNRAISSNINQEHLDDMRLQEEDTEEYFDSLDNIGVVSKYTE